MPRNIAVPFAQACARLQRPPILSYDGYALYNWKRFRRDGSIAAMPDRRPQADKHAYNEVLKAMAEFREVHYGWAREYIERSAPRICSGWNNSSMRRALR